MALSLYLFLLLLCASITRSGFNEGMQFWTEDELERWHKQQGTKEARKGNLAILHYLWKMRDVPYEVVIHALTYREAPVVMYVLRLVL